ncbi:MAG: hypothetical protein ACYC3O_07705 [Burkholderiales bacterium]
MMQQVTLRLPAALASAIDQKRGTETVTNYIKRVLAAHIASDQDQDRIVAAIESSKSEILTTLRNLAA